MRQLVRSRGFVSGARESARREVSVSGARRDEDRRGRAYLAGLSGGASCFASGSGSYATRMSPFAHSAAISSVSAALSWGLGVRSTLVVGVDFVSGCRISAAEGDRTREGAEHGRHGAASRQSRWTMDLEDTRTSEPPRPACTPRAASGTPCLRASRDGMCAEANASAAFLTLCRFRSQFGVGVSETTLARLYDGRDVSLYGAYRGASYYPIPRHLHALASPESVASSFSASTAIHAWSAGVNPRCVPLAATSTPSFPTGVTATACAFFGR